MDEHCRGGHQQVGCAMCQQSLPKHSLEVHEQGELHEHHCGRRTKLCPGCGQLFMLHVLAKHRDVCRGEQARLQEGEMLVVSFVKRKTSEKFQLEPEKKRYDKQILVCPRATDKPGEKSVPALLPESSDQASRPHTA
ncbi:XIAP-associated factor 1 [Camelus dromedarius]|uniref:XIAP-associated factor 1 n=1 Tax=Camelus dromedarius TaxID=9838 RepID=A0A5N4D3Q9_CAMDR|nr:XIAP-associated factor 1 [Camelus dromedarius]